jgi:hypothetical protein
MDCLQKILADFRRFNRKFSQIMYTENQLSYMIRGAAFMVYNTLGPGLLESVYETALAYELKNQNLAVISQ